MIGYNPWSAPILNYPEQSPKDKSIEEGSNKNPGEDKLTTIFVKKGPLSEPVIWIGEL